MPNDPTLAPSLTVTIDADTRPLQAQLAECTRLGARFGSALSQSFVDLALRGKSFGDVLRSLALRLSEIALKAAFAPLTNALGSGLAGLLAGGFGFAHGGVIQRGMPVPFADGGIIASPIAFPLAGNRSGVAGERGPEAILPLARGADAHRGAADPVADLTPDDLVETRPDAALATLTRAQETDLPASAKITYIAAGGDYPAAVEEARRLAGRSGRVAQADLPLALDAEQAAEIAEVWLFEAWAARERAQFSLPPSRLALEPGDVLDLTVNDRSHLLRITEVGEHGQRDIEARGLDPDVYANAPGATRGQGGSVGVIVGQPFIVFLDLPLLRGDEPPAAGYVAAAQTPWPGPIAVYRSPETSGFQLKALALAPAITGVTLDPLSTGATSRFDRATSVRVKLDSGTLASVTELALLGGANLASVRNGDGQWEVLQFLAATLIAPATYTLTGFLRGQAGTEHAMRTPLAAGARFVLLDGALARVDQTEDEIALPFNWKCGPASRDIGSPNYVQLTHTFVGEGLEPLSPVHIRGLRSSGDLALTWVRRTRIGGDTWDGIDVPLGETEERYEIDILDGTTVKRTLTATTPAATYTAAQQTADFGAPQPSISLRIHQTSPTRGRGTPRAAVL